MLTPAQIAAAREVRETLQKMERATKAHHRALKRLAKTFENELPPAIYAELTDPTEAGTPKPDDD